MTDGQPVEKKRSRRIYILWGVALALLLALGLFSWLVVVPVWRGAPAPDQKPPFSTLEEAVAFIAVCLEADDYERLSAACVGKDGRPSYLAQNRYVFDVLKARHQKTPLRRLYAAKAFPADKAAFKLGGHRKELGHIHIDFEKKDGVWVLKDIWVCR